MTKPDTKNFLNEELQRRMRDMEYDKYVLTSRNRRMMRRRILALAFVLSSIAFAVYILFFLQFDTLQIPLMLVLGAAFSGFALFYLQPSSVGFSGRSGFPEDPSSFFRLRYYIDEKLSGALEELKSGSQKVLEFTEQDKSTVLASIQAKLESEALQSYVAGFRELVLTQVRDETLDERFQHTRRRLGQEVQDLAKRGNLNLVLGIMTTLSGLGVLGYAVFNPPATLAAPELLSYFIPRVSLVVLIEVFAYFFLSLYKQSLGEIKYFQNEITNVEAKQLALQVTLRADDSSLRSKLVEELAKTERNFILTKDQTTVDLERERMARGTYAGITEAVKELLKKRGDA